MAQEIYENDTDLNMKPIIRSLENVNKLGDKEFVSDDRNSITIKVDCDFGNFDGKIMWKCDGRRNGESETDTFTISGLGAGITYTVEIWAVNSMGTSDISRITIRTRRARPFVEMTVIDSQLEWVDIDWECNQDVKILTYQYGNNDPVTVDFTEEDESKYHPIRCYADPSSLIALTVDVQTTDIWDSQEGTGFTTLAKTLDISTIGTPSCTTFGEKIELDEIKFNSDNQTYLTIEFIGNERQEKFIFNNPPRYNFEFIPTQDELDKIYKCFGNLDIVTLYFTLTTVGEYSTYDSECKLIVMELTGNAKTVHTGSSSKKTKRAQVYIGDGNKKAKKCVTWVAKPKARRTI